MVLLNTATGEVRPLGCARLRCDDCRPRLCWRRGLAIAHAAPERFCTLTRVGGDWQTVRNRMKRIRHHLIADGFRWEWVWSVEPNPKGTGRHVHAWQRGTYVPQQALADAATREGCGRVVDIRAWRKGSDAATAYALKSISYGTKGAMGVDPAGFVAMNGGRLSHQSRGWWTVGGARDQEREAIRAFFGDSTDEWLPVHAGSASGVAKALRGADPYPLERILSRPRPDRPL